jgi:hypothetical protein
VKDTLRALQADVTAAYQRNFVSLVATLQRQASALDRLQTTLQLLVERIAPDLTDRVPVPIRVVEDPRDADLSAPIILADPIGAGYTMTQAKLAAASGLSAPVVSVLVRALGLNDDGECAIAVRKGPEGSATTYNYHPRSIARLRQLIEHPPGVKLDRAQQTALARARRALSVPGPR